MNKVLLAGIMALSCLSCVNNKVKQVNTKYEVGQTKNGNKVGIWEYSNGEETVLKINYDNGHLLYLEPDSSEYLIKVDSLWELHKPARHPRYLGSYPVFYKEFAANLIYPYKAAAQSYQGTVFLEIEVGQRGKATAQVLNDADEIFTDAVLIAFRKVPNYWVNAVYDGKNVAAKIILPVHFKIKGNIEPAKFDKEKLDQLEGKKFTELIVVAYEKGYR